MPSLAKIQLILRQPIPVILKKVKTTFLEKISTSIQTKKYEKKDFRKLKFSSKIKFNTGLSSISKIKTDEIPVSVQDYLTNMYIQHRFDLLGTGWIKNSYFSDSPGIEGIKYSNPLSSMKIDSQGNWLSNVVHKNHIQLSQHIWKKIQSEKANYEPIDWQKDYKSGFRFESQSAYTKQYKLALADGIDLKMPWELGRLQHLPQLAIFYKNNSENIEIIKEYKCQMLDFIMTNPIGMGVNWSCTMDVGIRAANICLAQDWFKQLDRHKLLDPEFDELLNSYLFSHAKHIENNFEYKDGLTSNHYLGNIAGLTFISSYLKCKEQNFWLAYSIQELKNELEKQFFDDGSNFEGSTAYHRLSGEMIVYCFALLHKIESKQLIEISKIKSKKFHIKADFHKKDYTNQYFLTNEVIQFIYKMNSFSKAYTKPNGTICQIGDNDSGRFFRLTPTGNFITVDEAFALYHNLSQRNDYQEELFWDENHINHSSFIAASGGFFELNFPMEFSLENHLVKNFINKKYSSDTQTDIDSVDFSFEKLKYNKTFNYPHQIDISTLKMTHFKDFGFIRFSTPSFFVSICFGTNSKSHHSLGHQHNDKASIELQINGKDIIYDPGTYIYTPLPKWRNHYRSTTVHSTIQANDKEQNSINPTKGGLFSMKKQCECMVIKLSQTNVIVQTKTSDYIHYREIIIEASGITIHDSCNIPFEQSFKQVPLSNGYGKLIR